MNLTERLHELAEAPAPPTRVDVARAATVARRRRLARRTGIMAGIAAAATSVAVAAPGVLHSLRQQQDPAGKAAPMIAHATFGWLPDSITRVDFGTGAHGEYTHAVNENDSLGTQLWLSVYQPGEQPPLGSSFVGKQRLTVPATPINGQAAFWATPNASDPINGQAAYWATTNAADPLNGGDAYLYWHVNGKLVELHGYYLGFFTNPQDVLLRVAAGATIGDRPVPLPVKIRNMPADLTINEATFDRPMARGDGTGAWDVRLFYNYAPDDPAFTILVHPEGSMKSNQNRGDVCRQAKGVELCVTGLGGTDPQAALDHFTILGLDESQWVTH